MTFICPTLTGGAVPAIQFFTRKYAFLSPLYRSRFYFDGDEYLCAAAAFEASKIANRSDRVSFVGWNVLPWNVAKLAKNIRPGWMRPDWTRVQFDIMLEIQRSKFSWPALSKELIAAGDANLVYGNAYHDNVWGVCQCHFLPSKKSGVDPRCTTINSSNHLGRILMKVRQERRIVSALGPTAPTCAPAVLAVAG
jgi:ribA/ribD-fused uncharacterized protein